MPMSAPVGGSSSGFGVRLLLLWGSGKRAAQLDEDVGCLLVGDDTGLK